MYDLNLLLIVDVKSISIPRIVNRSGGMKSWVGVVHHIFLSLSALSFSGNMESHKAVRVALRNDPQYRTR